MRASDQLGPGHRLAEERPKAWTRKRQRWTAIHIVSSRIYRECSIIHSPFWQCGYGSNKKKNKPKDRLLVTESYCGEAKHDSGLTGLYLSLGSCLAVRHTVMAMALSVETAQHGTRHEWPPDRSMSVNAISIASISHLDHLIFAVKWVPLHSVVELLWWQCATGLQS